MSAAERKEVEELAEGACQAWDEAELNGRHAPATRLQRLLDAHWEISQYILNIKDSAIARDLGEQAKTDC
jgi:hypothetical protein